MKRILIAAFGAVALSGCAAGYYGPEGPGPIAYDGYYDDYYGPIYDGYWGDGGVFYYRSRENGHFRADRNMHFRRDMGGESAGHFHPMHGNFTPPAGGRRHR